jgi:hypothetical protein
MINEEEPVLDEQGNATYTTEEKTVTKETKTATLLKD